MKTSKPFTFILHITYKNEYITDMTIVGVAHRSAMLNRDIEYFSYSIDEIIIDRNDLGDISTYIDMQQVNNACFNYTQTVFADDIKVEKALQHVPVSANMVLTALAN